MRSLSVRPSRMLTTPSVVVKNKDTGDYPSDQELDERMDNMDCETAAIPLSQYRSWGGHKQFNRKMYEKIFRKYTGDAERYRIYLPVAQEDTNNTKKHAVVPQTIIDALDGKGYVVEDYVAGIAADKKEGKRKIKIGKLLAKDPELKKIFDADPQRHSSKTSKAEFLAVISRHPYDLAGMSTNRGWTSCMNLKDGCNKHYVIRDVKYGTLVAYLVRSDDKNINKPIGRVRIYKFTDEKKPTRYMFVREPQMYPKDANLPKFEEAIENWIEDVNKFLGIDTGGSTYCLVNPKKKDRDEELYTDDVPTKIRIVQTVQDAIKLGRDNSFNNMESLRTGENFSVDEALNSGNAFAIRIALTRAKALTPKQLVGVMQDMIRRKEPGTSVAETEYERLNRERLMHDLINHRYADSDLWLTVMENPKHFDQGEVWKAANKIRLTEAEFTDWYTRIGAEYKATSKAITNRRFSEFLLKGLVLNPLFPKKLWMQEILEDTNYLNEYVIKRRTDISDADAVYALNTVKSQQDRETLEYAIANGWDNLDLRSDELLTRLFNTDNSRIQTKILNLVLGHESKKHLAAPLLDSLPIQKLDFSSLQDKPELGNDCILKLFSRLEAYAKEKVAKGDTEWIMDLEGARYLGEFLSNLTEEARTPELFQRVFDTLINPKFQDQTAYAEETLNNFTLPSKVFENHVMPTLLAAKDLVLDRLVFLLANKNEYSLPESVLISGIKSKSSNVQLQVMQYTATPLPESVLLLALKSPSVSIMSRAASHINRTIKVMKAALKSKEMRTREAVFEYDSGGSRIKPTPELVKIGLTDEDPEVRYAAAEYCTTPEEIEIIIADSDPDVRSRGARNSAATTEQLLRLLKDQNTYIQRLARAELTERGVSLPEELKAKPARKKATPKTVADKRKQLRQQIEESEEDLF